MRSHRCGAILPAVLVLWSVLPALAQAPKHPLDGLTASEHWAVYDTLRASGRLTERTRYGWVALHEPSKAEVLAWKPGAPFRREAFVVLMEGPKTCEAVVDLATRRVSSWRERTGVQIGFTDDEQTALGALVKDDDGVRAALARRGITDPATVECWPNSVGYFGLAAEEGRRLAQINCGDRHGAAGFDARPIEGLSVLVDVHERRILKLSDSGPVPLPLGADYDAAAVGRTRAAPAPLLVQQPLGPGFTLDGHEVGWQRWRFHFRVDQRRGLVLSRVLHGDGDKARSVLYQASLSEIFVPYMDPAEDWYRRTYLDAGDYTSSWGLAHRLEPGSDCPGNAVYFDGLLASSHGIPNRRQRVACLFERAGGEIAWRHLDTGAGTLESRPRRDLVLRMVANLGNYDYVFDWVFQQDGTLAVVTGATGIVAVKAVASRTAAQDASGRDGAFGRFVADRTVAVNHDHFFSFRLDLDVDGTNNSFVSDNLKTQRLPEGSPRRSVWVVDSRTARSEREGQLDLHAPALWRVVNPGVRGPLGYPVSYEVRPGHSAGSLLLPEDYPQKRAGFTEHALWITPYRPDELYAAGDYPNQSRGGDGLPAWTAADRPIEKTDIVAWYTLGMHHVVRAEDWPVMPVVWHAFELRPFDFFERNPALDLPAPP